jgi:eukaryotic-like serine/threonine-protein kinase
LQVCNYLTELYSADSKLAGAMAILSGRRLGPYEILSAIGAGGMGEVYKARDTRLDRIVAIKVLSAHLADRAELRDRFDREAKTIASLNHPHICTLYDTGHQDEIDFLVMEYIEGETLAQRLLKGSLPIQQVLQYAIEIADALDKAHRKGITHRDLKPGNIMLTKSGTKLLDFGLAKLKQEAAPAIPDSQLPTLKSAITGEGTILGTLQYMAPEQVEAKEVDARTDIFAFGAVVYEMATGKKAFEGKTSASVMAKILESDPPPMSLLQPMTPPALDHVVKKCLVKEPEDRWQSAKDLADELKWIADESAARNVPTAVPVVSSHISPRWMVVSAVACLVVAAIAAFAVWLLRPTPPRPVTRFAISLPAGQRLAALEEPVVAVSQDGTHLAYVATQGGNPQLYLRTMDSLEAKPIPSTEGAAAPFFSPDSQWVGFFASGKLKKVSVTGGAAVTVCEVSTGNYRGASWGSDGSVVFQGAGGLWRVSAAGGTPQRLTTLDSKKGENLQIWPEFLPGGKAVLSVVGATGAVLASAGQIVVRSQQTGERRDLIGGTRPTYAPTGHLIYAQAGTLMAVPFDAQRLAVTGSPVPVLEAVLESPVTGVAQYSISNTGSLVYVSGGLQGTQRRLVWVDRKGAEQPLSAPSRGYRTPRLSPDGRRVAVGTTENQVWLYDLARETLTRLTFEGSAATPIWTPDGKRVAFQSNRPGTPSNVFRQLADGSGSAERLTTSEYSNAPGSWSPDGQVLAFMEVHPTTGRDLWTMNMSGDRKPQPFLRTQFNEGEPRFSPDGRWLTYISDESGRYEIYVQPYPGPGGKWQISTEGGTEPVWGHNGEIFYRSGNKMLAVDTTTHPSFSAGKPKVLFESPYVPSLQTSPNYDVSADGQRFVMIKENEQFTSAVQINVVLNWFEELKQKVPTGKK